MCCQPHCDVSIIAFSNEEQCTSAQCDFVIEAFLNNNYTATQQVLHQHKKNCNNSVPLTHHQNMDKEIQKNYYGPLKKEGKAKKKT